MMFEMKNKELKVTGIALEGEVRFLLQRLERHAPDICKRSWRVSVLYERIARLAPDAGIMDERVLRSVLLQDIGFLRIGKRDLRNPRLCADHPVHGMQVLQAMVDQGLVDGEIILGHHENLDGTGYPSGLGWKELSIPSRVLWIADHLELVTGGIYSPGNMEAAIEDLYCWSDIIFDGEWVERLNEAHRAARADEADTYRQV